MFNIVVKDAQLAEFGISEISEGGTGLIGSFRSAAMSVLSTFAITTEPMGTGRGNVKSLGALRSRDFWQGSF